MRKRKVISVILVLIAVVAATCWIYRSWFHHSSKPALAWRLAGIRSRNQYWVRDHMEPHCWCVQIEVSNMTSDEVIVDWNRDKTSFQMDGKWQDLGLAALMPYLEPNGVRTLSLCVPQQSQACRILMNYEDGPFWSKADRFLQDIHIHLSDRHFTRIMDYDRKRPEHFKQLVIEVKLPAADKTNLVSSAP